jgi:hypothetical protein
VDGGTGGGRGGTGGFHRWLVDLGLDRPGPAGVERVAGVIAGVVVAVPLIAGAVGLAGAVAARLLGGRPG